MPNWDVTLSGRNVVEVPPWYAAPPPDPWVPIEPGGPSPHLTWEMLAWIDPVRYTYVPYPKLSRATHLPLLVSAWEATVQRLGAVPGIVRAYWSTTVVWRLRVSRECEHVRGTALDVVPPPGWTLHRLADALVTLTRGSLDDIHRPYCGPLPWRGVIIYPDHIHLQVSGGRRIEHMSQCLYPPPRHGAPLYRVA